VVESRLETRWPAMQRPANAHPPAGDTVPHLRVQLDVHNDRCRERIYRITQQNARLL
jgi:hypothetical protein